VKKGRLFGSVTSSDIATELGAKGFEIDRRKVQLPEALKTVGEFTRWSEAAPRSDGSHQGEGFG
jgi:ribosomal protein L9